jgi:1-deoxy-D-xylulose-5-phosphate reductoisomerase
MKNIAILGSTGSIGLSTLNVIEQHPEQFRVAALTAHRKVDALFEQCLRYNPTYAVMVDPDAAEQLRQKLHTVAPDIQVLAGYAALEQVASAVDVDYVMAAIVGAAGLASTLAAARAGKRVLLANKESLVMAGALLMAEIKNSGAVLLPIDSEHNAIFQCFPTSAEAKKGVRRIVLTASGGPFRTLPLEQLAAVTPQQAAAHPNWSMGTKISIDSATMLNKGLEVIEAHWLFDMPAEQIDVLLHPQSIIHSLVEYTDGSLLAQFGNPDLRIPIAYGLGWPDRIVSGVKPLDLIAAGRLDFAPMDFKRYPCLQLSYEALRVGGTAPTILNAANEEAVDAFRAGKIRFTDIPHIISKTLEKTISHAVDSLAIIQADDAQARETAEGLVAG